MLAVYAAVVLKHDKSELAELFDINLSTLYRWIQRFKETGSVEQTPRKVSSKFDQSHRSWIVAEVNRDPLQMLDEM